MFQRSAFRFGWCMVSVGLGLGLLMLALVGCHDAHRDNPFDPVLTPPVELISVVVDTTTGTATLQWTPYAGSQPFAAYWVMRKVRGIEGDTLLTAIPDVHRTRFGDQSLEPNRVYVYWIAVVNQGGFVQSSAPDTVVSFSVHGSRLLEAVVDEVKGSVFLRWSSYRGPRFERYELRRRAGVGSVESPVVFPELSDTTWTDLTVDPETEYVYSLVTFAAGEQRTTEVRVTTFSVHGSRLLEARADSLRGTVSLRWERYRGARFERYEIRRSPVALKSITQQTDTTWVDMTALPETEHVYSVATFAAGRERVSNEMGVRYHLPSVELARADFDYLTATAELSWSVYSGPRFEAYEIHRQAGEVADQTVAVLTEIDRTTYTDSLLDGNTIYTYWISVRTGWGIKASSNKRQGRLYGLEHVWRIPSSPATNVQAVSLAFDEQDHLYIAIEGRRSPAGEWVIVKALSEQGEVMARQLWASTTGLDVNSPVRLRAGRGKIHTAIRTLKGQTLVSAAQQLETGIGSPRVRTIDTGGASPAGLHLEENGDLLLIDDQGLLYRLDEEGKEKEQSDILHRVLVNQRIPLPLRQVIVVPGAGMYGGDLFILLAPGRADHSVFGRTRMPNGNFIGGHTLDDGLGVGDGETLNPVALALDYAHERLLVLESHGRLQVLDGRLTMPFRAGRFLSRYITKWGAYGDGDGEFLASAPNNVAMVVDSAGRVYVADILGKDVRIQVFRP